jgi:dCMP deaminase
MSGVNGNSGRRSAALPEYIENWDQYFLWMAEVASRKSKDPRSKVGAVIVSTDKVVIATGFNGLARGVFDDEDLLANQDEKLKLICHAELNAIMNAARVGAAVMGCCIYVNKFPCVACCNAILQSGIGKIYTHDHKYWDGDPFDADHSRKKRVLKQSKIEIVAPFHPDFSPKKPVCGAPRRGPRRAFVGEVRRPSSSKKLRPH